MEEFKMKTNYEKYLEKFNKSIKERSNMKLSSMIGIHPSQLVPHSDALFITQCQIADEMGIDLFSEESFLDKKTPYKIKINREKS